MNPLTTLRLLHSTLSLPRSNLFYTISETLFARRFVHWLYEVDVCFLGVQHPPNMFFPRHNFYSSALKAENVMSVRAFGSGPPLRGAVKNLF